MCINSPMDHQAIIEGHRQRLARLLERLSVVEEKVQEMMRLHGRSLCFTMLQIQLNHVAVVAQIVEDLIDQEDMDGGHPEE